MYELVSGEPGTFGIPGSPPGPLTLSTRVPVRVALPRRVRRSPAYAGSPHSPCRHARAPRGHRPPGVARTRSRPRGNQAGAQAARRAGGPRHP
eukprot:scaffold69629_cov69-Phaeocystis_antarctica.AAC.1